MSPTASVEEFLRKGFCKCPHLKARIRWTECARRHLRKRMIRSFGRKLEQYATPQDKLCRQCPDGAERAKALLAMEKRYGHRTERRAG